MLTACLTYTLPWPPIALNPNSRPHYMVLARSKKAYRASCGWSAREQGAKPLDGESDARINVHLVFVPPDRRARDEDNLVASMKSGLDGLADALGVDDKRFRLTQEIELGRIGGYVRVTVGTAA